MRLFGLCGVGVRVIRQLHQRFSSRGNHRGTWRQVETRSACRWKAVPPKSRIVEYEFQAPGPAGAERLV